MSHQASSARLHYLDTHHFSDWFDNNESVRGLLFAGCLLYLFYIMDAHLPNLLPKGSSNFLVTAIVQTSSMHVM